MNLKRAFLILIAAMLLPGLAMAQETVRFSVTKTFADDNPAGIEVTISCNTGLPLTQNANIDADNPITFVVEEVDMAIVECAITEDGEAGYTGMYMTNGAAPVVDGCMYTGDVTGNILLDNTCAITNAPTAVPVVITKEWVFEGAGGDAVDTMVSVFVHSESEIVGGGDCNGNGVSPSGDNGDYYCLLVYFNGPGEQTVMVVPNYDGSDVYIEEESIDSAVESENGCNGMVTVYPTMGSSCLITNTAFFEGIPTLNQYGLAILAVLMLGVGFVGFRRFV